MPTSYPDLTLSVSQASASDSDGQVRVHMSMSADRSYRSVARDDDFPAAE